jgi:predicted PurR-regulated permease PerM
VVLPVALLMFFLGHPWAALFLALWGLGIVGLIDNVVKPLLIKSGAQLDAAVLFFALIGGLALLGAVGLVVGPLAVALFVAVVTRERRGGAGAGAGSGGSGPVQLISRRSRSRPSSSPCCGA